MKNAIIQFEYAGFDINQKLIGLLSSNQQSFTTKSDLLLAQVLKEHYCDIKDSTVPLDLTHIEKIKHNFIGQKKWV
jgi:hypothetical protein